MQGASLFFCGFVFSLPKKEPAGKGWVLIQTFDQRFSRKSMDLYFDLELSFQETKEPGKEPTSVGRVFHLVEVLLVSGFF